MLCYFQIYSKMIQLYIYSFFFRFFSHIGYPRILSSLCYTVHPCWSSVLYIVVVVVVQLLSYVRFFVTPGTAAYQASLHYLPEFVQTYVHWVGDAIQPSHPVAPFSALNLSQHQGLFQWVGSSHKVAKVLELQHQSPQWIFRLYLRA